MQHETSISVAESVLTPRFSELTESDAANIREFLPYAEGTATHGFSTVLDGTHATIENLESILAKVYDDIVNNYEPEDEEKLNLFIFVFGVYLGEVFRREHDAEWLNVHYDQIGVSTLCVRTKRKDFIFMEPLRRVHKRLKHGAEYNVAEYYRAASRIANAA